VDAIVRQYQDRS